MCIIPCSTAQAEVYRWFDEKGNRHFSDQPRPRIAKTAVAAPATTRNLRSRSFKLPGQGVLLLNVPGDWRQKVSQPAGDLPPTIVFTPAQGNAFKVLLSPLWSPKNRDGYNSPQETKRLVSEDLAGRLPGAVEKEVPLQVFRAKYGEGYYFLVTDKNPGEGYPYAMRAGVGVGQLLLSVTVLSRSKDSEGISQTLQALREAEQGM